MCDRHGPMKGDDEPAFFVLYLGVHEQIVNGSRHSDWETFWDQVASLCVAPPFDRDTSEFLRSMHTGECCL